MEDQRQQTGESSCAVSNLSFLEGNMVHRCPQKIKLFVWKECKGILPTKLNLFRKGISSSLTCPICEKEAEYIEQVFYECDFAQDVWEMSNIAGVLRWPRPTHFADLVDHGIQNLNSPNLEIFFTLMWKLWIAQNEKV